jgi:hypothetical protein
VGMQVVALLQTHPKPWQESVLDFVLQHFMGTSSLSITLHLHNNSNYLKSQATDVCCQSLLLPWLYHTVVCGRLHYVVFCKNLLATSAQEKVCISH